ncbi:protein LTV1 [Capsicum chacoense]
MGKKKFIDKKKAATFQLFARDSSDPGFESGSTGADRVFVRVDNNTSYSVDAFHDDPNSIFADAPDDEQEYDYRIGYSGTENQTGLLPDDVRKEILELGFPDDGYNYLEHLREIKNTGGGSAYYENPKAKLNELPHDVKAYDASRVEVAKVNDDSYEKYVYNVAAKTVGVRVQKAVDPEVAALLDDSDLSRFGSDDEDLELEEDFVIKANVPDGAVNVELDNNLSLPEKLNVDKVGSSDTTGHVQRNEAKFATFEEKPRARRLLDEQFDLLELEEYCSETEDEYDEDMLEENEHHESLAEKLNHAFKECAIDNNGPDDGELLEPAADVISRCREYAEKYENENPEEETALFEESSSDSEVWDCETIVSTYSNLDNHPGKIVAPESRRKKLLPAISEASPIISLKGKEKLPVDYLPSKGKHSVQKEDKKKRGSEKEEKDDSKTEQLKRKQHGQESKEEKKERKAAVKEDRREARRMKKETKELYKCEAQRAQKVAAFTGPSAIHLM